MDIATTIVEKSYAIFYKHGFHDSGVELLAKQAGTTKRTLYAHFGNKEGLIKAVLSYRHEMFMSQLANWFEPLADMGVESISQCYLGFLQDWVTSDNFYGCLFINACAEFSSNDTLPHTIAKNHKHEVRQFLLNKFEHASINNPQQVADTLFVLGEGIIVSAQTGQEDLNWNADWISQCLKK